MRSSGRYTLSLLEAGKYIKQAVEMVYFKDSHKEIERAAYRAEYIMLNFKYRQARDKFTIG